MSCAERDCRRSRPARAVAAAVALLIAGTAAAATTDLSALVVTPERGQSAEQARRDRYECHNWAVEQTGSTPVRAGDSRDENRPRRLEKVALGAAIGAAIGGIFGGDHHDRRRRHDDDTADAVLGGAVVGAAAGAIADRRGRDRSPDANADYLRALSACLEGRGYSVSTGDTTGTSGEEQDR